MTYDPFSGGPTRKPGVQPPWASAFPQITGALLVLPDWYLRIQSQDLNGNARPDIEVSFKPLVDEVVRLTDASVVKANKWADWPTLNEVEPGRFSALHWATVAQSRAENARDEVIAAVATVPLSQEDFSTVAALLADTALTYTSAQPKTVTVGQIVPAGGFRYQVAASTATDHHVTTAGGVKLYVLPGADGVNVKACGAKGDGTTDDTSAIQLAFDIADDLLRQVVISFSGTTFVPFPVVFPDGTYLVQSSITLPASASMVSEAAIIDLTGYSSTTTAAFQKTSSASKYYFRGITFKNGSYALNLHNTACFLQVNIENCKFLGQSFKGVRIVSDTYCAEARLDSCEFHGAATNFAEIDADLIVMSKCSTNAAPNSTDDSASFALGGRIIDVNGSIFSPGSTNTATQRAWLSLENCETAAVRSCTFGGEIGRRTAVNVIGNVKSLTFESVNANAAADTNGQLSSAHVTLVRLFGDYLERLVVSDVTGNANGALIDFATGVSTTLTLSAFNIRNTELGQTPSEFIEKINNLSGIVKRPTLLPIDLRTTGRRAFAADPYVDLSAADTVDIKFDVDADYQYDGATVVTSTNSYLFEITGAVTGGGGGSNGVLLGIVSWSHGVTNSQLYVNVLVDALDQTGGTSATVTAVFSTSGTSTQARSTSVTTVGGVDYYNLRNAVVKVQLGGTIDWIYAYAKLRPLFNSITY